MARNFIAASLQYLERTSAVVSAPPFTMACWYKPPNNTDDCSPIGLTNSVTTDVYRIYHNGSSGGVVQAYAYDGVTSAPAQTAGVTPGTWTHMAAVFASTSNRSIYVNGANKVTNAVGTVTASFNRTNIGVTNFSGGTLVHYANGPIAEAGIWNVALDDIEIAALGAGVSPLLIRPNALVAYWPLLGSYSPEIDIVGHNDLTLFNAPLAATHPRIFYPDGGRFTARANQAAAALANTSTISFSTSANLGKSVLSNSTRFGLSTSANLNGTFTSRTTLSFSTSADLRVNALRNSSTLGVSTRALLDFMSPPRGFYSLRIEGHERADLVRWDSVSVDQQLGSRKVANFVIEDPDGVYFPQVGNAVVITQIDGVTREFYGSIETASRTGIQGQEGGTRIVTTVECVSREQVLDRHLVAATYANQTLRAIVLDIIANNLQGENISAVYVETGPTIESAVFPYITVAEAFNDLANLTGYMYWLDDNDGLHFQARSSVPAPFDLNDDPLLPEEWPVRDFTVMQTRQDYRNRQYVRAGTDLTTTRTELFEGDGTTKTYTVSFPIGVEPSVTVNGVAKTMGIRGVETGFDWYWNKSLNAISQDDGATALITTDVLAVTYRGEYPIIASAQNDAEILSRMAVEGGSGIYEGIEQDGTINSSALALKEAEGFLNQYGLIKDQVTFWTYTSGLRVGQIQRITSSKFGVEPLSGYLITSVAVRGLDGWPGMQWTVTALSGAGVGGWVEFFQGLAAASRQFVIRQNELLLTQNVTRETVFIQDSVSYEIS